MLSLILFDVGRTKDAVEVAVEGIQRSRRAGFDTSFGTFHSGVAAPLSCGSAAGRTRTIFSARSPRSNDTDRRDRAGRGCRTARRTPGRHRTRIRAGGTVRSHPADAFSEAIVQVAALDVRLATKEWEPAMSGYGRARRRPDGGTANSARLTPDSSWQWSNARWISSPAEEDVDVKAVCASLERRIDAARAVPSSTNAAAAADLAFAEAMLHAPPGR